MARACVCDDYFTVDPTGELCLKPGTMGLRGRVIFDEIGVRQFEKADYPWLARVRVQVQGGGGGSAGATADSGELIARPGAPAGAWAERLIEASALGAVETVVVGAGGAGGTGNNAGGAGGTSSFGGFVIAAGAEGGAANPPSGTAPVTARGPGGATTGTGDLVIGGGGSGVALRLDANNGFSGAGGDSQLGHGGNERRANGGGEPPTGWGAGAGGAFSTNGSAQTGTAGGQGVVIVELYG
ncbi:hypothetical protein QBA54_32745 [Streptomyces sp. B21-108]|uniref:glycine-rich domain-containing protein n=1 Tax=Streptomyces sp. B21-108 TaxID=3039419 RepID=UPI002FEF9EB7